MPYEANSNQRLADSFSEDRAVSFGKIYQPSGFYRYALSGIDLSCIRRIVSVGLQGQDISRYNCISSAGIRHGNRQDGQGVPGAVNFYFQPAARADAATQLGQMGDFEL